MPIDASIPLQSRTPQQPSTLQTLSDVMTLRQQQRQSEQQERQFQAEKALDEAWRVVGGKPDPNVIAERLSTAGFGHLVPTVMKSFADMDAAAENARKTRLDNTKTSLEIQQATLDAFGAAASGVKPYLSGEDKGLPAAKLAIENLVGNGLMSSEESQQTWDQIQQDPALLPKWVDGLIAQSKTYSGLANSQAQANRPVNVPAGGTLVNPQTGQTVATGQPRKAVEPNVGSFEGYVVSRFGPNPTPEQIIIARQDYAKAGAVAATALAPESTESMAEMVADGRIVPGQLSKRTANYNEIIARADQILKERTGKGYSAARSQMEFNAASRFVSSLNGPQQVRFRGLGISVVNTIDEVKQLAQEMNNSGLTFANKLEMEAKLKVMGNSPQGQLVARYIGAVNTLKEEFANLINGGYAPTEAAFALANRQVNENYGVKAMEASLNEVQRLINFRLAAFEQLSPAGVSPDNPVMGEAPRPQAHAPSASGAPGGLAVGTTRTVNGQPYTWDGKGWKPGSGQAAAPSGGKVPMTRQKAAQEIQKQTGKAATPAQIEWFLKTYPYEQ